MMMVLIKIILYNFDVIKATTRKSVYIINHNIIFKGCYIIK